MMPRTPFVCAAIFALFFMSLVSGCGSTPQSRFYSLTSLKTVPGDLQKSQVLKWNSSGSIGIGPLDLADYLDRPQIVTRTETNEIFLAEFDRWGGSLRQTVTRAISENVSTLLGTDRVFAYPWRRPISPDYQVLLTLTRFDGVPGGILYLSCQWSIVESEKKRVVTTRETRLSEKIAGPDYRSLVRAMSEATDKLSIEIAQTLSSEIR